MEGAEVNTGEERTGRKGFEVLSCGGCPYPTLVMMLPEHHTKDGLSSLGRADV